MAKEKKTEKEKKPKRKKSKILLFLASLFSAVLMLAIAGGVVLGVLAGTEEGRASVFRYVSAALLNAQGWSASYAKISSTHLRAWRLEGMRLAKDGREAVRLDRVDLELSYAELLKGTVGIKAFRVRGMAAGKEEVPEALAEASGQAGMTTKLDVSASGLPLALVMAALGRPLPEKLGGVLETQAAVDGEDIDIKSFSLALREGGSLEARGRLSQDAFDLRLKAKALPSRLLIGETDIVAPGALEADIHARGTRAAPLLSGTLGYATRLFYSKSKSVPVAVAARLETAQGVLRAQADITRGKSPSGKADIDIPLAPYLAHIGKGGAFPLRFSAKGSVDVEALGFLFDPALHTVQGRLEADVSVTGTTAAPVPRGDLRFARGRYRNALTGTDLHQIEIALAASDTGAVIKKATATDGGKGRLSLEGDARWGQGASAVNVDLDVRQANLLRRPDVTGHATGRLKLAGDARRLALSGVLDVSPLTVMLESAMLASIPEIEVVDVAAGKPEREEPPAFEKMLPETRLDVTVKAERQAFLRGRGMDVELAGKVTVTGTLAAPVYNGAFKTLRGECRVLGKRFVLQNGEVRFDDGDMSLDVTAVHRARGTQIQADLSGQVEKLNVKLSSVPSMPQDEIMARLLFGAPAKSISPLQAARLALALKQLKDGGSAVFDPVGAVRDRLGLDQLNVGADETGEGQGVSVGAGKYIGDKIYLEVEKTPDPANPWKASAEIEINDNVSIETTTGANPGSQGVGIQWKRDY